MLRGIGAATVWELIIDIYNYFAGYDSQKHKRLAIAPSEPETR